MKRHNGIKTVEVPTNRTIVLPKRLFKPLEKIALFTAGNMLIIKKVDAPRLSAIAKRAKTRPLSLRSIVREVHAYRRAQRG